MDSFDKIERRRQARHRIRAQRARAGKLKTHVVAISLICFALLWGVVFVQMATGNDPVLGDSSSAAKGNGRRNHRTAKATGASTGLEEFAAAEPEEGFAEEPAEEQPVEEEPAPVITGQS